MPPASLMSATAIFAPWSISWPAPASGPVSGWMEPMTTSSGLEEPDPPSSSVPQAATARATVIAVTIPESFLMSRAFRRRPRTDVVS